MALQWSYPYWFPDWDIEKLSYYVTFKWVVNRTTDGGKTFW